MSAILEQLGLDGSFFIQVAVFAVLFFVLTRVYFRPFMKLFDLRHQRIITDRQAAEKLMSEADSKFEDYKNKIAQERAAARRDFESVIQAARADESAILGQARDEAKKITQSTAEAIAGQRDQLKKQLEGDVDVLATAIAEKLLSRKV
ncbi:MAG TPA: hypothetical protein DCS07_06255 [Bdellovibrionales bacterium]|nr:MAG: hypothetical protein A2Z97_05920 [Bdellovibrionales bacterium GWB1_52_6]OFZ04412.1 MAG: hypothetical protein A2X97_07135 [Bdellovibrionales bacterium GWA1_52_35]OFZ35642.1 MAG: hypothetical protein A2070_07170 [Bdellovibrionales bacterium GWC1_52_8]HAR42218.1 hypothetical protein [Bdellovibrionales bacterium]HCM40732.1 hypothetical protein [Bdellovibrionales bacterium]